MFHLNKILLVLTLIFTLSACSSNKKNALEYEKLQNKPEFIEMKEQGKIKEITLADNYEVNEEDFKFTLLALEQIGHAIRTKVQYGGGCVKPHVFELVTNGIISKEGKIEFWLVHKTYNDMCKALLTEDILFDFSEISIFNQNKIKTIVVNNEHQVSFKKFE